MLKEKYRKENNRKEWALLSRSKPQRVLKWFGVQKPSEERVAKEEQRVNYFKKVAAKYEDKLPGGLADKKTPEDFSAEQVEKGVKVEMEHTDDPELAREIAMDHLTEDSEYYDHLAEMEQKFEQKVAAKYRIVASTLDEVQNALEAEFDWTYVENEDSDSVRFDNGNSSLWIEEFGGKLEARGVNPLKGSDKAKLISKLTQLKVNIEGLDK